LSTNNPLNPVDRQALRARYDAAVAEINPARSGRLTTPFYAKTGDAMFTAGCAALDDHYTGTKRMHTLSAPAGAGKTSFAYTLIAAVTREAEENPAAPYGCVFVVDQIERADTAYSQLSEIIPGQVAIWTSEHDVGAKEWPKLAALGRTPAARFHQAALPHSPVAIVTHNQFMGNNSHHALNVSRGGYLNPGGRRRALTIIDEQPQAVSVLDIQLSQAEAVREKLRKQYPHATEPMNNLLRFMEKYPYVQSNKLFRPGMEIDKDEIREQLAWFGTTDAEYVLKSLNANAEDVPATAVFQFAHLLSLGFGLTACENNSVHFCAWKNRLVGKLEPGTVLLDATADIAGVSKVIPWMTPVAAPQASYRNLEIVHVNSSVKNKNLTRLLSSAPGLRAYQQWMLQTIRDNTEAGQKCLVVCKTELIDHQYIPNWPPNDERFKNFKSFTTDFGWELDGRLLSVIHWGSGVGSNAWEHADVVILCDEWHLPRRVTVANTQGYREHQAHEGDLGAMTTLRSSAPHVDVIANGHLLRNFKQMALRGNARHYDANGACGEQKLVIACDLERLLANVDEMFPGATVSFSTPEGKLAEKALSYLNALPATASVVTTAKLGEALDRRRWGEISKALMTPKFLRSLKAIGWRYVSVKGRGGSRFERCEASVTLSSSQASLVATTAQQPMQEMTAVA
jgi:hypothetical protein